MTRPYLRAALGVLVALAPAGAAAQEAPRTPWGDPDLQGTYTNKTITPLERPEALGDKVFLTDEEVAEQEQARVDRNQELLLAPPRRTVAGGNVGGYNNFWLDGGTRPTGRTSLIVDPPAGRLPARTGDAAARKAAHDETYPVEGPFDSWEDLELNDRCLVWSAGPPMLPSAYNNNFIFLQTPDHVVIYAEMIHDTRIIPIDGRGHLPAGIRQWHGDARGYWEGDTLVVETANYSPHATFRGLSSEHLRVTERFTRAGPRTLDYEVTIDDPTTYTRPWTVLIPLMGTTDAIYEYACHEGNVGMDGILAGHRAEEREAAGGPR